jgi:hypothetical protein
MVIISSDVFLFTTMRSKTEEDIDCMLNTGKIKGVPSSKSYILRRSTTRRMGAKKLQSMASEDSYYMLGWEKILG